MRNLKEKVILSISIGCVALILTMVMFTQFKTIEQTDIVAIETMRETELRTELADWKAKYEEVGLKLEDTNQKLEEYHKQMTSEEDAVELLRKEVDEAHKFLGYTDVQGEGIIVTLEDNSLTNIDSSDLLSLVNELKLAGAEAIAINEERIVASTDIALINNRIVLVNGKRISGPYLVKAIGDMKYLESAITIKGGYIDSQKAYDKTISYRTESNLVINQYGGELKSEYINRM